MMSSPIQASMVPPATKATPLRPRGSSQIGLKQFNERVVLQAIRLHGALPKAELARLTGLTSQTIGLISARLMHAGLLLRESPLRGRIGQPSVPLSLNPDGAFGIGIKIGRRSTDSVLVDLKGQVRKRLIFKYPFPDAQVLLPTVQEHLRALQVDLGPMRSRLAGVGVAAPFQMGGWHKMLGLSSEQSEAWNKIDLGQSVQEMTDLPVYFARDTAAACVAELIQGRGRDLKSFLYIFVDTFVGGGLVLNSQLHAGTHGNAGAVASLPMSLAHEPLPDRQADEACAVQAEEPPNDSPEQLISQASLWDLEQHFVKSGLDPTAAYDERAMQEPWMPLTQAWTLSAANALAHSIVSGTAFVDVDAVVIDGSLTPILLAALLGKIKKALLRYRWEGLWMPQLHPGVIGNDARALGGALLPLHANFAPDNDIILKVA
jgi:predicted NBD/HSP70 family sugar kinase